MKTVVAGALGECVHVPGSPTSCVWQELAGWRTVFLGPAVPIDELPGSGSPRKRRPGGRVLPPDARDR